ncbi:hypothetical protein [Methylotenera sp. G11]|uniref:hypothetical protein n=1 Tax=Methylotenera sp. G11 TaxID=1506585 RepID=UPI00064701AF|nr:hypothetical protein [Methylotenera sp. G11]
MKKHIYLALFIFGVTFSWYARAAPEMSQHLQQNLIAAQDEVKQLKAQLQIVESYQDKLLSTVYWSLGTLATIAALLVGFSWFANFRIYERDKTALRQELHSAVEDELRNLRRLVEDHVDDSKKTLTDQIIMQSQAATEPLKKKILANERTLSRGLANLELEIREIEHTKWREKKVYSNALRTSRQMLDISLITENRYDIADALDRIQGDLGSMLKANYTTLIPDAEDVSTIVKTLDRVDAEHLILVSSIKDMLAKVRTVAG